MCLSSQGAAKSAEAPSSNGNAYFHPYFTSASSAHGQILHLKEAGAVTQVQGSPPKSHWQKGARGGGSREGRLALAFARLCQPVVLAEISLRQRLGQPCGLSTPWIKPSKDLWTSLNQVHTVADGGLLWTSEQPEVVSVISQVRDPLLEEPKSAFLEEHLGPKPAS